MGKDDIAPFFDAHGPVSFRKMFGGLAFYVGGRIVGMELDGEILLKGDAQTRADYEALGMAQWGYSHAKTGKQVLMPYWVLPADALDDPDQLQHLADLAWAAASRAK